MVRRSLWGETAAGGDEVIISAREEDVFEGASTETACAAAGLQKWTGGLSDQQRRGEREERVCQRYCHLAPVITFG